MVADNINSAGQLSIQLVLWSMPQELLDIPTSFIFSLYWASLPLSLCSPELWSFIGPDVTTVYIWSVFQSQDKALENRPVSSEHYVYHLLTDLHTQRRTHTHTGLIQVWLSDLIYGYYCWCLVLAFSVTPEWIHVLIPTACYNRNRTGLNSCSGCGGVCSRGNGLWK